MVISSKGVAMANRSARILCRAFPVLAAGFPLLVIAQPQPAAKEAPRITVLYDAFGKTGVMKQDWGYAAIVEYAGKRILFDSGSDPSILASNVNARRISLSKLDFVIMSHRHSDHMGGLAYVLRVNPGVKIYAPREGFGVYGGDMPGTFYRRDTTLAPEQRYYDGSPPEIIRSRSAWSNARFQLVNENTEIAPDVHLITLVSDKPGTLELRELSLAINTPDGLVLVVGCSHPGIDKIVQTATTLNSHVRLIMGGFHLMISDDREIADVVTALHDRFKVDYVAPGHCTGEPAFAAFRRTFGDRYIYAGLGTRVSVADLKR
jgi:7,8-dihydropterin-6-yl-methyl-4-(beta-D-ribofuranosyl)aminobenzene 5'-phosphate synthase